MPTGYTAPIEDGTLTSFPEFAMRCARAFGALIEMRDYAMDAPIPEKFAPDSYHQRELTKARKELAALSAMTPKQIEAKAKADNELAARTWADWKKRAALERSRYEAMLAKVEAWQPPTPDHVELKKFMADQIRISMSDYVPELPKPITAKAWLTRERGRLKRDIAYHAEKHAEEVKRAAERSEWVAALRASL